MERRRPRTAPTTRAPALRAKASALARVAAFVSALSALTPTALAGSLDDFRDSVDRRQQPPDPPAPQPGTASPPPTAYVSGTRTRADLWWSAAFVGHTPGASFSFGDGVYDGRGYNAPSRVRAADLEALSLAEPLTHHRQGHIQLRLDGLVSPNRSDGPALNASAPQLPLGFGVFAKLESTVTPGLVVWHERIMDFSASDRLGVTLVAVDPRIWTGARGEVFWTFGVPVFGSENGVLNAGACLGFGFDAAPVRPLVLNARLGLDILASDVIVGDIFLQAGVEFVPGVAAVVGFRDLVSASPLQIVTLGVQLDRGFGR
ncbi:MAG: hypothetical protein H6698_04350 [Myxococcales bacterium]|nr:hypothetical protein [Myxococcales bacterium]MCB9520237.1 hypothetical protein [Myxococcales bacterium]MCB9531395.1 hypothetical protein [Myxococcales bacterium]MCB9533532.1 hypothetical protein [Myxococcales bacterium]